MRTYVRKLLKRRKVTPQDVKMVGSGFDAKETGLSMDIFPFKICVMILLKNAEIERVLYYTCFYHISRHEIPGFITFSAIKYHCFIQ